MVIFCVVVTYNRLSLFKECIAGLKEQTVPLSRIIIVDNHSNDGTSEYLSSLSTNNKLFQIITMPQNVGGSGGFSEGIKHAALAHADWIWIMDDDTIPQKNTLEQLLPYTKLEKIGFVNSTVVWTDGSPHLMNQPCLLKDQSLKSQILKGSNIAEEKTEMIISASFVSLLIRGNVPWEIGLPYKEFFIWCDDSEYTNRIISKGYYGVRAIESIVLHKTRVNYVSSLKTMPASEAWKLYYGVRNESFLRRKRKGWLLFILAQINCFRTHAHRIKKRHLSKEEERLLLTANNKGLRDGIIFNPKIDFLQNL